MDTPVVLVTGATSGIGLATAKHLAANGYRVFGTSRNPAAFAVGGYELVRLDVTSDESVGECVRTVLGRTGGRLDALVSNVGTGILGAAEESDAAEVRDLFETNFFGAVRVVNAVLPAMRRAKSGRILVMGSSGGTASVPFASYYCATKFALEAYCEGLRGELLPLGIHVSVVAPGPVSTPAGDTAKRASNPVADYHERRSAAVKLFAESIRQGMPPENVAEAILGALRDKSPAPRYPVGAQAGATLVARRLLPVRWFQWAVRRATG